MSIFDEIALVLISGVTTGSLGFAVGLGVRPGLQARVEEWISDRAAFEINHFVEQMKNNPKFVSDLTTPLISSVMSQLGQGSEPGAMKDLKIGGIKIPAWAVQLGMQFMNRNSQIKRVYDVTAPLLQE